MLLIFGNEYVYPIVLYFLVLLVFVDLQHFFLLNVMKFQLSILSLQNIVEIAKRRTVTIIYRYETNQTRLFCDI